MEKTKKEQLIMWLKRDLIYILCILIMFGACTYTLIQVQDADNICKERILKAIQTNKPTTYNYTIQNETNISLPKTT